MKKKNKGFTLAELLIVVAIVGVLVAISIPIFSGKLQKAREATDLANGRSAKACILAQYATGDVPFTLDDGRGGKYTRYYYDAENGVLTNELITTPYGQGKGKTPVDSKINGYQPGCDYTKSYIVADFRKNKEGKESVIIYWTGVNKGNSETGDNVTLYNGNLLD